MEGRGPALPLGALSRPSADLPPKPETVEGGVA